MQTRWAYRHFAQNPLLPDLMPPVAKLWIWKTCLCWQNRTCADAQPAEHLCFVPVFPAGTPSHHPHRCQLPAFCPTHDCVLSTSQPKATSKSMPGLGRREDGSQNIVCYYSQQGKRRLSRCETSEFHRKIHLECPLATLKSRDDFEELKCWHAKSSTCPAFLPRAENNSQNGKP